MMVVPYRSRDENVTVRLTNAGELFDDVALQMREIMVNKEATRGRDNIRQQGLAGVVNRIGQDKMARVQREVEVQQLRQLLEKYAPEIGAIKIPDFIGSEDSLTDDLMDIANYCIIAILLIRGQW